MTRSKIIAVFSAVALLASAGTATAHKLITGADIRNGTVAERDLDRNVRTKLNRTATPGKDGQQGPAGRDGSNGASGASGAAGAAGSQGPKGDTGAKGEKGLDGAPGAQGPKGDTGAQGPEGVIGLDENHSEPAVALVDAGTHAIGQECDTGKVPVGGGYRVQSGEASAQSSYPTNTGWHVDFVTTTDGTLAAPAATIRVYVICANA